MSKLICRPPYSDSEDDYDGFSFGDEFTKKQPRVNWFANPHQELCTAVEKGNLDIIKQQVNLKNLDINTNLNGGYTLLLHACKEGHLKIVEYLLYMKAEPNKHFDSVTPLMVACDCSGVEGHVVAKIVKLLLEHGAIINTSDKFGYTPLMFACKNGHKAVVREILKDASLDAVDNNGYTAIFHAIENNHAEIVRLLVEAGADCEVTNDKGYSPLQVAQFHGFYDLLDILPKEQEVYIVPSKFLSYHTLRDCIPRIFLKSECPEYFQEIHSILLSIKMEKFLEYFAKQRISLAQFLCMNNERLEEVGIPLPLYRMKIVKGLLHFHLSHWSRKPIIKVNPSSKENFYEILMITASHLQHLVIVGATLRYINNNYRASICGSVSMEQIQEMKTNLTSYHTVLNELKEVVNYLASFSPPKSPLYIDYDEYLAERKRYKMKSYFKYTTIALGISIFICFKVKKVF